MTTYAFDENRHAIIAMQEAGSSRPALRRR